MGMTTLLQRPSAANGSGGARSSPDFRLPVNPRRRRSVMAAASAVVVFLSVGLFAHIYAGAGRQAAVLVVTHTVQQGQQLTAADLGQTSVAVGPGVARIPAAEAAQVLGKSAALTVSSGSLLTPGDVSSLPAIPAGDAVVGLALKVGQLPADGLGPGDQVMVVETGPPGSPLTSFVGSSSQADSSSGTGNSQSGSSQDTSTTGPSGVLVPNAVVFNTAFPGSQSSGDTSELVSLELSESVAPAVSAAAAADQVSLLLIPGSTGSVHPSGSSTRSGTTPTGSRRTQASDRKGRT